MDGDTTAEASTLPPPPPPPEAEAERPDVTHWEDCEATRAEHPDDVHVAAEPA